jgi:DNA-binding response OmpR family regulator
VFAPVSAQKEPMMKKILVVDDNESIRMLYADELTEEGYYVITHSGDSRLMPLIKENRPDLIVMDLRLGNDNGLALLQEIRSRYYSLPVILCTAYPVSKCDLKTTAADHYVVKSSDLTELKTTIKGALKMQ